MNKDNKESKKKETKSDKTKSQTIGRRDLIKGLATVPVLGAFSYAWLNKTNIDAKLRKQMREVVTLNSQPVDLAPAATGASDPCWYHRIWYSWQTAYACSRICRTHMD